MDSADSAGIYVLHGRNVTIRDSLFELCEAHGIHFEGSSQRSFITNNVVRDIGFARAICEGINCAIGILTDSDTSFIETSYNHVYSIGYIGIRFDGKNHSIHHNHVHGTTKTLSDGGAIYAWGTYSQSSRLTYNIVYDSFPNSDTLPIGSGGISHCLYFDDYVGYMYAAYNVLYNCYSSSLYLHDSVAVVAEYNLLYNSTQTQIFVFEQFGQGATRDNVVRNNLIISARVGSELINEQTVYPTFGRGLFGTYYSNVLCSPYELGQLDIFYASVGGRQYGNFPCSVPEARTFAVQQTISSNLLTTPNWANSSGSIGSWSRYPGETNVSVTSDSQCGASGKCALWSCPFGAYPDSQSCLFIANGPMNISASSLYLIDIEMVSSENGSVVALLRDRSNYRNIASGVSVQLRAGVSSRIYGIATPTETDFDSRLDLETRVTQKNIWVRSASITEVRAVFRQVDSIIVNPGKTARTFSLPNGQKYLGAQQDPMSAAFTLLSPKTVVRPSGKRYHILCNSPTVFWNRFV